MQRLTRAIYVALLLALASCGDSYPPEPQWQDYQKRLARVLDTDVPGNVSESGETSAWRFPRAAALRLPVSAADIDLLDFLRLRQCKLATVLAEKNSILGRYSDDAFQLHFTLAFLSQVDNCIGLLVDNDRQVLAEKLIAAKQQKQQQLPRYIFNALFAGPEYHELWTASAQHRQAYPPPGQDTAIEALRQFDHAAERWLKGNYDTDGTTLFSVLDEIRRGLGGELMQFYRDTLAGLNSASAIIQRRLGAYPLCLQPRPVKRAEYFRNVLQQYYIVGIQQDAATADRHRQHLLNASLDLERRIFDSLAAVGDAPSSAYIDWQTQRDELFFAVLSAHREHAHRAERLLLQCGLQPGTP